jgi:hypothetical protein
MRNAAGADNRDSLRDEIRSAPQRLAKRPRAMQRRQRRPLTIDVDGNHRKIVLRREETQRHHDAVIEFPFLRVGEIHGLHHFAYQPQRQARIAGNGGASNAQPLRIFDGSFVILRHAHRESGHVVHEKIRKVLGCDHDQGIGFRGGEVRAHIPVGTVELFDDGRIGHMRAPGDARRVTADAREHEAHISATFSSNPVVIA